MTYCLCGLSYSEGRKSLEGIWTRGKHRVMSMTFMLLYFSSEGLDMIYNKWANTEASDLVCSINCWAVREMTATGLQLEKHDPYFLSITLINCVQNGET